MDAKIQTYSVTTSLADDLAGNKAGDGLTDEHWEEEGSRADWRVGQGDLEELREIIERGEEYHSTSPFQYKTTSGVGHGTYLMNMVI